MVSEKAGCSTATSAAKEEVVGSNVRYCATSFPSSGMSMNHESQTHTAPDMLKPFRNYTGPGLMERQVGPWSLHSVIACGYNVQVVMVWVAAFRVYKGEP